MMALARMGIEYPRKLREEGWKEGYKEGFKEGFAKGWNEARVRNLLLRQATRKFDVAVARRLGEFLADTDATGLAAAGDWIIDCNTGEELIARASRTGNCG